MIYPMDPAFEQPEPRVLSHESKRQARQMLKEDVQVLLHYCDTKRSVPRVL